MFSLPKGVYLSIKRVNKHIAYGKSSIDIAFHPYPIGMFFLWYAREPGGSAGGYNASQFGALAGTVAGAAVGNAVTTPRQDDGAEEEYDNYAPAYSGLHVTNLRFIDENRNHTIDAEEDSKLVFDVVNDGDTPAYNVTPIIEEVTGMKHILISPAQQIAYMPVGNTIRYTATIRGGRRLKTGEAVFRVYTTESNGAMSRTHEFSLPTQKRKK